MRILVVDDNEDLVTTLGDVIADAGHVVRKCSRGRTALDDAKSFRPQVILLDLAMPDMDGFEVCKAIRSDRDLALVKVIAISGMDDGDSRRRTAEAGFDLLVRKPVNSDGLIDILDTLNITMKVRH